MTPLAIELAAALKRRRRSAASVAREVGLSHSALYNIQTRGVTPTMESAEAIAEALDWDVIATITRQLRTKVCPACGATFLDRRTSNTSLTCGQECAHAHYNRTTRAPTEDGRKRRAMVTVQNQLRFTQDRLSVIQAAVLATCMECSERTLICRIPECGLQAAGVSPARLPERRRVA